MGTLLLTPQAKDRVHYASTVTLVLLAALLAPSAAADGFGAASPEPGTPPAPQPPGTFTPAQLLDAGDGAARSKCYSDVLRRSGVEFTGNVILLIEIDGKASVDEWPAGASAEFRKTVECVLPLMRIAPATQDGVPVASRVRLPFQLALADAPDERVVLQPPRAVSGPEDRAKARAACVPAGLEPVSAPMLAIEVDTGGKVTRAQVVESSGDPRVDEAARCIARKTRFAPGTRNGYLQRMTVTTRVGLGD